MKQEIADDLEESLSKSSSCDNIDLKESSSEKREKSPLKNKEINNNKTSEKNNSEKEEKDNNNGDIKKDNENNENINNEDDKKVKKLSSDSDIKKIDTKMTNSFYRKGTRRKSEDYGDYNNTDKKSQMFEIYADLRKEKPLNLKF